MNNWDELTPTEQDALALIKTDLGWEPKSARGFVAGYAWGGDRKDLTAIEIADAYHDWFYSLPEGTQRYYRHDVDYLERK